VVEEVEGLLARGQWSAVVTRSYYGMFCLARALVFYQESAPADQTRELRKLDRLTDDAERVAFDETVARQSQGGLLTFRAAVEGRLREYL
jgi:hypothetical protein